MEDQNQKPDQTTPNTGLDTKDQFGDAHAYEPEGYADMNKIDLDDDEDLIGDPVDKSIPQTRDEELESEETLF